MKTLSGSRDGKGLRIGIVVSRFHRDVTGTLLTGALRALRDAGVSKGSITVAEVPGAVELPFGAQAMALSGDYDAIACLGAVVRGETAHFEYVSAAAQQGIVRVALDFQLPVTFGVLTTDDVEQAKRRAGGDLGDKGAEAALDAVEMANLARLLKD